MSRLTSADKALCAVYAVLGLAALVGTQIALVRHMTTNEGNDFADALSNTVVNAAATFTVIDLLAVALIGLVFMVVEGRRLGMRFLWVYVVLTFAIAISVALPAFLIARQVHLASERQTQPA
jgi:ABC-type Fe3+ transport system permease subunit